MQGFAKVEIEMKAPKPEPHPGEKRSAGLVSDERSLMKIHRGKHQRVENSEHLGHRRNANAAAVFPQGGVAVPMETIFNGTITNDKFCMSRMKPLQLQYARQGSAKELPSPPENQRSRASFSGGDR